MSSMYKSEAKGWRGWTLKRFFDLKQVFFRATPATASQKSAETDWATHFTSILDPINTIYGSIRGSIDTGKDGIVVHIVSATPGEGSSSVAKALAQKAATLGHLNVYLIDGSDTGQGSAFAAIKSTKSYLENSVNDPHSNDPSNVQAVYAACRKEFQLTIVDCPPVSSGEFFETMPKSSDSVIMIVQAEKLRPVLVRQIVEMLEQQGVKISGAVLTKTRQYIPPFLSRLI